MSGSTARKFNEDQDPSEEPHLLEADAVPRDDDDALGEIDWSDLQDFFFQHLRGQFDEMARLLGTGDLEALARIGHGIKGSGGGVLLPRFTELGRDLEDAGKASDGGSVLEACRSLRDEYLKHRPEDRDGLRTYFAG